MIRKIIKIIYIQTILILSLSAQDKIIYKTQLNIPYYDNNSISSNEYRNERCKLDIYYPENLGNFSTIVWFHGGGLSGGNRYIAEQLKNNKIAIVAVNYRLHPKVKFPKYIEDAAASIAWVFKNIEKYGGDPKKIFVSGHSAGGYLTSIIGLDKSYLQKHGVNANDICGLIPFSGHTITHFTVRKEMGISGYQPIIDESAPLYHIRNDCSPLILITGDRNMEMLGRYEENAYMWRMMQVVEHKNTIIHELDGFDHGGMVVPAYGLLLKYVNQLSE